MWQSTVSPQSTWSAKANGLENWEVKPMPIVTVQGYSSGNHLEVTAEGKIPAQISGSCDADVTDRADRALGTVLVRGSTGTQEIPVKVDAEGRLMLASDVTVNAEGLTVDLGQIKQGPAGTEPWPVQLSGSKVRIASAPATGVKTVTGTAAEVFAGTSCKPGRSRLEIANRHPALAIRVGPAGVTDTTGRSVGPLATLALDMDPMSDVPIYAVSEAGALTVEVFEA